MLQNLPNINPGWCGMGKANDISVIDLPRMPLSLDETGFRRYALQCFGVVGLSDWLFDWDRAIRRLGCCHYSKRRITLSIHFFNHFRVSEPELVRRTLLHEMAHALAFSTHREHGHGRIWKKYCAMLGIPDEKSRCKCDDFSPSSTASRPFRYALCHTDTGEVFHRYKSRPRISPARLAQAYITGRKKETLGKLVVVECFILN